MNNGSTLIVSSQRFRIDATQAEYGIKGDSLMYRLTANDDQSLKSFPVTDKYKGKIVLMPWYRSDMEYLKNYVHWKYFNVIDQLLNANLTKQAREWSLLILLVLLPLFVFINQRFKAIWSITLMVISAGFLWLITFLLMRFINVWVDPSYVLLSTLLGMFMFPSIRLSNDKRELELKEKERLMNELRTAHDMQMGLMPTSDPSIGGFDISGVCKPAEEVGGDYFDYVWLNEEKTRLGIAIADVSGKAMKAAMTAVMTSGMVYRELGSNETPKTILRKINRPMYFKTDKRIFTAMSFAVIDTLTKSLAFSNAGQMQPLLKRNGIIESLKVDGARLPLGMAEDVEYNELTISLQTGDTVVFYTDGIPEAMNIKNEMFGFEQMEAIVKECTSALSAKQVAAKIVEKVAEFTGVAKQHDDMTVVAVRVF